jgi:hypothetical protein
MKNSLGYWARPDWWRVWGPLIACVVLTATGLGLLIISGADLAHILLLVAVLTCPLALAILWQMHRTEI